MFKWENKTHKANKPETNPRVVGGEGSAMSKAAVASLVKVEAALQKVQLNIFLGLNVVNNARRRLRIANPSPPKQ